MEAQLSAHNFDWSRGFLVQGYFHQSLTPEIKKRFDMERAALVMVDCDLDQSTVPVLDFIGDLLQEGTVILFDDWYCFGTTSEHGETRALGLPGGP